MLRMSLNPIDYGGYAAYFFRDDVNIDLDENTSLSASGTKGCLVNRFDSLFVFRNEILCWIFVTKVTLLPSKMHTV